MDNSQNTKRIAKNTLLLYGRMLLMMVISLYTSRVVFNALGVDDYGIYNVVGGFVSLFSILSGTVLASISRFITYELGRGDEQQLKKVFCTSVNVQVILIFIIVILLETVGIWYLNNKMVIPYGRLFAAKIVFQLSVLTFTVNLFTGPYHASIIAHEKMSVFAFLSIVNAVVSLLIAILIRHNPIDRLVYFGILNVLVGIIISGLYIWYSTKHFEECKYEFVFDRSYTKKLFSFAGWSFFGAGSGLLMDQGVNLLINSFFGVTVNAARSIAVSVNGAVTQFVTNFTTALNPQITKSYASEEITYMYSLVYRGAKFSSFLVAFFAIPIMCETEFILRIWLGEVPEYTAVFVRLALLISSISVLQNTLVTTILATGDIQKYQLVVGGLGMLVFPLAWLFFYLGFSPVAAYTSTVIVFILQFISRLFLLKEKANLSIAEYFQKVFFKVLIVIVTSSIFPLIIVLQMEDDVLRFFILGFTSVICSLGSIWLIGLNAEEKQFLVSYFKSLKSKIITK